MAYAWEPTTAQVAVYVPWLTISKSSPGSQEFLGDFTGDTVPDAAEAQLHIADAAVTVGAVLGTLNTQPLQDLARVVVSLLAAASLAQSYARSDEERALAAALTTRAALVLAELKTAADAAGAAPLDAVPICYSPSPVPWGDQLFVDSTWQPGNTPYPYIID